LFLFFAGSQQTERYGLSAGSMSRLGQLLSRSLVSDSFLKDFIRRPLILWDHAKPSLGHVQPSLNIICIDCAICLLKTMVGIGTIPVCITHGGTPKVHVTTTREPRHHP
jgi:hypothetical protein